MFVDPLIAIRHDDGSRIGRALEFLRWIQNSYLMNSFFIFCCLAIWMLPAPAMASELTVGATGARFTTVAEAISAALAGDTIIVQSGVYVGNIRVDKPLILRGVGRPVVRGAGTGSVVSILADGCTFEGFDIEHSGGDLQDEDSGILVKSNRNLIADNRLRDILYGVYLYGAAENRIVGNRINGRSELETGDRGAGLHLWNSANNTLLDNTVIEARDGMYIQSSPGNIVKRNNVSKLRYGLHYMSSDDNTFEDNVFSDNVAGAAIMYSKRIQLRRNAFIRNRGFSSFGILFQDCDDCLTEDNFIIANSCGLFLEAVRKGIFRNNVIADNDVAMQIFSSADQCEFTNNNFVENLSPLLLVGVTSNTRWDRNYWSDYDGYDLDNDGIGDIGHKVQNVFSYLEGNYPRLRLYLNSPAAQALANAEKTIPLIKGSPLRDASPLARAIAVRYPFIQQESKRWPRIVLAGISILMFCGAAVVLWKGKRR